MKKQSRKPVKKSAKARKKSKAKIASSIAKKPTKKRVYKTAKKKISASQKRKNEKLRRLRISRSHALRAYQKYSGSKTNLKRRLAREKFAHIIALNRKITDLEYVKVSYNRLSAKKGWNVQDFGHVGRAADNFFNWFKANHKYFTEVDGFKPKKEFDLIIMRVQDMVLQMASDNVLRMKYKDGIGFTYIA